MGGMQRSERIIYTGLSDGFCSSVDEVLRRSSNAFRARCLRRSASTDAALEMGSCGAGLVLSVFAFCDDNSRGLKIVKVILAQTRTKGEIGGGKRVE